MPRRGPDAHEPMTGWYDPRRLLSIGIRVAEATVFGEMFDRRELMASLDPFEQTYFDANFDFSGDDFREPNGDFWFDFAADTGDGWDSTYAVGRLLARPQLRVGGEALPQGRVLIFGGDQVYPTASEQDYRKKLKAPFDAANALENPNFNHTTKCMPGRYVFAIPGNHDWYDDLTAFTALFCNKAPDRDGAVRSPGRNVCGRATAQTRSYFALKLPQNWWLCAFDAQLAGYIDAPQMRFFEYVAQNLMEPGSNVILSVAGPVWAYSQKESAEGFSNFAFAALIATGAIDYPGYRPERQHNLRLVLTGDSHHYAHFVETAHVTPQNEPAPGPAIHYLTCGLGGAFLHPTHWLTNTHPTVHWAAPPPVTPYVAGAAQNETTRHFSIVKNGGADALYPDRAASRRMTWRNLFFAALNPWFGIFLAAIGIFATWLLHFGARTLNTSLQAVLGHGTWSDRLHGLGRILIDTPWPLLVILGIGAALCYFSDFKQRAARLSTGIAHTLVHLLVYFVALLIVAAWLPRDWMIVVVMGIITGLISPSIMGLYLLVMLNGFGLHWNEAYSSLRIDDFKGFLRLRISKDGDLTVYPIVLDKVPRSDKADLNCHLFDGPLTIHKTVG